MFLQTEIFNSMKKTLKAFHFPLIIFFFKGMGPVKISSLACFNPGNNCKESSHREKNLAGVPPEGFLVSPTMYESKFLHISLPVYLRVPFCYKDFHKNLPL